MRTMELYTIETGFNRSFRHITKCLNRCLDFILCHFPAQGFTTIEITCQGV